MEWNNKEQLNEYKKIKEREYYWEKSFDNRIDKIRNGLGENLFIEKLNEYLKQKPFKSGIILKCIKQ